MRRKNMFPQVAAMETGRLPTRSGVFPNVTRVIGNEYCRPIDDQP